MSLAGWVGDVRRTFVLWAVAPLLPVVVTVVAIVSALPVLFLPAPAGCGAAGHPACTSGSAGAYLGLTVLSLPVALFGVGLYGGERWWYGQVDAGTRPGLSELWTRSWRHCGRFLRLGLLVCLACLVPGIVVLVALRNHPAETSVATGLILLVVDVALTFITPALALSTRSVRDAVRFGFSMLSRDWPSDWAYVLVPPMALATLTRLIPHALGSAVLTGGVAVVAQLATCLFAGATTIYYIRVTGTPIEPLSDPTVGTATDPVDDPPRAPETASVPDDPRDEPRYIPPKVKNYRGRHSI